MAGHAAADTGSWRVYTRASTDAYSESVSLHAIGNHLDDELKSGDASFIHAWAEVGMQRDGLSFGVFTRYDWKTRYTPDTLTLIHLSENDEAVPAGDYEVNLDVNHLRASGIRLAWTFAPVEHTRVTLGASWLNASYLIDGSIDASVDIATNGTVTGAGSFSQFYSHDYLLGRQVTEPDGSGATIDLALEANWKKVDVTLSVQDLFSQIKWRNAPATRGQFDSATTNTVGGQLVVTPLLSAFEYNAKHTQRLPAITRFTARVPVSERASVGVAALYTQGVTLPRLTGRMSLRPGLAIDASYETSMQAFGIGIETRWLRISWLADTLDPKQARLMQVSLDFHIEL